MRRRHTDGVCCASGTQSRLAFLLPHLSGGGAERVALTLIKNFVSRGYIVDLLLMKAEGELMQLVPREVRVIDLKAARIRDLFFPLLRYLRKERPAGVQVSMWPLTIIGILAHRAAASRSRLVVSDHTTLSKHYAQLLGFRSFLMRASIRLLYPFADSRVIVSERAADDLAALSGIDRSSVDVIYNPIEAPTQHPKEYPEVEQLWGVNQGRILTVGSLKAEKNHVLLIRAFARLRLEFPARLMILGEGPLRDQLEKTALEEQVSERVLLPGFAVDPWPYFRSAHLFVLSSDYEGFGNVLVEAMHCGLPVVSTDCEGGPQEILERGKYGTMVPPGDVQALANAIEKALLAPARSEQLQARARELSGQGSLDRYLQLMGGEPGAATNSDQAAPPREYRG